MLLAIYKGLTGKLRLFDVAANEFNFGTKQQAAYSG